MMKSVATVMSVMAMAALLLTGCGSKSGGGERLTGEPIVIGMDTALSGGTAMQGEGAKRGVEMAIEEFNASGGYNGRPVKLVVYDDGANAERSVANVTKLLNENKVIAILGPANTPVALAHLQLVQDAKVPEIIPGATGTVLTQKFPGQKNYIFRVSNVASGQVQNMLDYFIDTRGFRKIAILYDNTSYGKGGRDDVKGQMAKRGQEPVAEVPFAVGQQDMTAELQAAQDAGAEAVIAYGLSPDYGALLRSRHKLNSDLPIIGAWDMADPTVKKIVGPLANKNVFTVVSYTIDANERARAFHEKVVERYGENIFPMPTAQGYDAARMLFAALNVAGPNPQALRDALENLSGFEAISAAASKPFSPENHEAITAEVMAVATYKEGELIKIK